MKGRKTGGRVKGTPNKVTSFSKEIIASMLDEYQKSGKMSEDFALLDPEKRMMIAEKLLNYLIPKYQSVKADVKGEVIDRTLAETLNKLADE